MILNNSIFIETYLIYINEIVVLIVENIFNPIYFMIDNFVFVI